MSLDRWAVWLVSSFVCVVSSALHAQPRGLNKAEFLAIKTMLVEEYPELSGSPGPRWSSYIPSVGAPGCEDEPLVQSSGSTSWVGIAGPLDEEKLMNHLAEHLPEVTCQRPSATVYFEPYRKERGRSYGALVNCTAPVIDQDLDAVPIEWDCRPPVFRQYVQLEDQACEVTLVGEMTDDGLQAVKNIGLSALRSEPLSDRSNLVKFSTFAGTEQWYALFGSQECAPGEHASLFFTLEDGADPGLESSWIVSNNSDTFD